MLARGLQRLDSALRGLGAGVGAGAAPRQGRRAQIPHEAYCAQRLEDVVAHVDLPPVKALVGRALGRYDLRLGANFSGERLNVIYRQNIAEPEILRILDELFGRFAAERVEGEPAAERVVHHGQRAVCQVEQPDGGIGSP